MSLGSLAGSCISRHEEEISTSTIPRALHIPGLRSNTYSSRTRVFSSDIHLGKDDRLVRKRIENPSGHHPRLDDRYVFPKACRVCNRVAQISRLRSISLEGSQFGKGRLKTDGGPTVKTEEKFDAM